MPTNRYAWLPPCLFTGAALVLIGLAYWPGLCGPFLLDDFGNLDVLGAYGRLDVWPNIVYYLSSGTADPTGRPLSLLSFLLDARSWPADPWAFKRTNLLLHLFNTALLAIVVARLQTAWASVDIRRDASRWPPVIAAIMWGAHPFFVSTTLYVVQREAMLPMTFVLLGVLAWSMAVSHFEANEPRAGWAWSVLGVGGATLLAGLSKANGFLAPILIGLTHIWFLRRRGTPQGHAIDQAAAICLGIPTLLILAYLAKMGWTFWGMTQIPARDWSLPQRLLSEPRAVWSYLGRLVLPRAGGGGLFVEDFPTSTGWFQPTTTLPALVALFALTAIAVGSRRRFPIASFGWLFFLCAQLMESSVIPLELYFEHRAYLAACMLGWPVASALLHSGPYQGYRRASVALLIATLLLLTHERAKVWGDPRLLGTLSAVHEAGSARAQVNAAQIDIDEGRIEAGLARLRATQREQPASIDVAINAIGEECIATGALAPDTMQHARRTLATATVTRYGVYEWMQSAASSPVIRDCRGFGRDGLIALLNSANANPVNGAPLRQRDLRHVRGMIALADGDPTLALHVFNQALQLKPDPDYALTQAAALGNSGAPALGVQHLDYYLSLQARQRPDRLGGMQDFHAWLLNHFGYYREEVMHLRNELQMGATRPNALPNQ